MCNCNCENNSNSTSLTQDQTSTNTQIIVPSPAKSDYELALDSGAIPPDTTLEEWLNRPNISTMSIIESGDNV